MASLFRNVIRRVTSVAQPIRSFSCMTRTIVPKVNMISMNKPMNIFNIAVREFHPKKKTNKSIKPHKYKLKSHKATLKRFNVTGTGRIMRWRAGKRHLARRKSSRQLRGLSKKVDIPRTLFKRYQRSLLYKL